MQEYLIRALKDDITDTQLLNVLRISLGKSMISNHALSKALESNGNMEIEAEEDLPEEEVEIDEIIESYIRKANP